MMRDPAVGSDATTARGLALDAAAAGIEGAPARPSALDQAAADTLLLRDLRHLLQAVAVRRSAETGRVVRPLDVLAELVDQFRDQLEAEAGRSRSRTGG